MVSDNSLRTQNDQELLKLLAQKRSELDRVIFDMRTKKVKDVKAPRRLRRQIARILTILHERQLVITQK